MTRLGPKAVDCLLILEMPHGAARLNRYALACGLYSQKAVERKLEELAGRGYVEYGMWPRGGWLTEKGKAALLEAKAQTETGSTSVM